MVRLHGFAAQVKNPERDEGLLLWDGSAWEHASNPQHGGGGRGPFVSGKTTSLSRRACPDPLIVGYHPPRGGGEGWVPRNEVRIKLSSSFT